MPTLKGTEASLPYVQCFLYLDSSSINVSIFHITWLDTFWTALYVPFSITTKVLNTDFLLKYWVDEKKEKDSSRENFLGMTRN